MNPELFIGMISGTSRDGVDAALLDFQDGQPRLLKTRCRPYPPELRKPLDEMIATARRPAGPLMQALDRTLGEFFAEQALGLLQEAGAEPSEVCAIGSHGQTVWHEPGGDPAVSLQLGAGDVVAERTGITAVTDFRSADLRAGGEGAPLAPLMHRELFEPGELGLAILNLGGIANLTFLYPDGSVSGFDTGPANCLMDGWILRQLDQPFDDRGAWAAGGQSNPALLAKLLDEPYFSLTSPKSTGLELFNSHWLEPRLGGLELTPVDVQRTLAELTVETVSDALRSKGIRDLLVCGGGVHNDYLMTRLADCLPGFDVRSTACHNVDPDWVEATLFAWLARERLLDRPQDTRGITGARQAVLLGNIHPAVRKQ